MTGGSKALAGFEPRRDAFLVQKLRDAGAIIIGKTNLHELGYGITTISSMGGQTRNPYAPDRNPGGSSGGTGAAVAASLVAAGMGTDTCGSIRNPASSNNLVGLRGTMGLSSRDGIIPLSHTQDIGGPLARSVTDLTIMLDATVGADAADPVTRAGEGHIPRSYREALGTASLNGERVGVLASLFGSMPEDAEVGGVVRRALDAMRAHGADVIDVSIPGLDALLQNTGVIAAEFKFDLSDFLSRFPGAPVHSLGEIIDGGQYDPAVEAVFKRANAAQSREDDAYRQSLAKRGAVREVVVSTLRKQHLAALAYPTLRRKPARIGQAQAGSNCQLSATTALPALSIPAGFSEDGVPIGMELLGDAFTETELLKLAYAYEQAIRPRRPPSATPPLPR
jgi:Asp-tRNA(Asn)/Glu-tRNA(Gln) amidotransferase A subunit family amidase